VSSVVINPRSGGASSTTVVLGAGGAGGWAFHLGALAGLRDHHGIVLGDVALVVGTSAGAGVAAAILGGGSPDDILHWVTRPPTEAEQARLAAEMAEARRRWRPSSASLVRGASARPLGITAAGLLPAGTYPTSFIAELPGVDLLEQWPASLSIVAVELNSGLRRVFTRDSGVEVDEAIEASGAMPGVFRPKEIGAELFVDGATHSSTNADLTLRDGIERVVVVAPMARGGRGPGRLVARRSLAREVAALRETGLEVLVVRPDEDAGELFVGFPRRQPERGAELVAAGARAVLDQLWTASENNLEATSPADRERSARRSPGTSVPAVLSTGDVAPPITLADQHGETVELSSFTGRRVLVYFYPRADTPGCTQQACGLRDVLGQIGDTVVLGISPDKTPALAKFDTKYGLGFPLLSDPDHAVAEAYGVWAEKKLYGKVSMGIVRSAFLVGPDGHVEHAWYKISPKDTPTKLLDVVGG
jgi:thioredoxin-dependent peroxiredoxin